jgi:FkbM family methyltransferase
MQVHHHRENTIVHAFEPNPVTFDRLRGNVSRNNLNRLNTHPVGISDEEGELLLHHGITDLGHSTFGAHPDLESTSTTTAKVHTFDAWVDLAGSRGELNGNRDWVAKIDVEGFEPRVLKGMSKSLEARKFRGIMVEVNPYTLQFNGFSPSDIHSQITKYGYRPLFEGDSGPHGNQFFERDS